MRRVLSGGKHPDLCERVLLRGRARERGSRLTREEHGESPAPRNTTESATMGCSSSFGGGEPQATSSCGVRMRGEGRSFTPGCSARAAHRRRINPSPAQPVAGSQRRPQAALRRAMTFSVPTCRRACSAGRRMLSELTQLAARSSRKGWAVARRALRKGQHGKRGQTRRATGSKGQTFKVGEDRTLEKVVLARR